ncbi:MAG: hypothetical protein U5R31_16820 [Acidimicrobiia bacterium]|nr:hypothetical protein [Acidimicrobiia bacterium]
MSEVVESEVPLLCSTLRARASCWSVFLRCECSKLVGDHRTDPVVDLEIYRQLTEGDDR